MTGQWEAICKEKTDKQSDIGTLPENEKKKRRSELGSLLRAVESAKRQVTRAIEEEGGAPHARAEEETEEESCSAESEMGAPDGAKAKPEDCVSGLSSQAWPPAVPGAPPKSAL